ncbi:uncharacterized protein LOC129766984 [Toxorhynchites rutilus septentrionalis]|uniref:uncharacterized protein LOC129766984 n=1 Tax=Toxorhynchites rutilus septentrionalis TaxID=329112 RepID=UPI002479053E|nr:uncharacterized protein LOC129766984 [Toxorhynchites rutilus septentrionalis]
MPYELEGVDLWWRGPSFLKIPEDTWSEGVKLVLEEFVPELIAITAMPVVVERFRLFDDCSEYYIMVRVVARIKLDEASQKTVWTDNGTNFVGAANLFQEWEKFFNRQENQNEIQHSQGNSIEWRFNPPEAPHFGGIWEANIRQTKALLVKQTGRAALSFEEMSTVLARIEAVLNSRPVTQLSDDPEDLEPLTPGHFLIFRPLTAVARLEVKGQNHPRSRFDHITAIVQHFWSRFQLEYISSLQERFKWHKKVAVKIGQLVLVKKDNMPVQKGLLGRNTETFAGKDGVVRVVNIKTQNGIMKRAVSELCFLPIDPDQSLESCTFQRAEDRTQISLETIVLKQQCRNNSIKAIVSKQQRRNNSDETIVPNRTQPGIIIIAALLSVIIVVFVAVSNPLEIVNRGVSKQ